DDTNEHAHRISSNRLSVQTCCSNRRGNEVLEICLRASEPVCSHCLPKKNAQSGEATKIIELDVVKTHGPVSPSKRTRPGCSSERSSERWFLVFESVRSFLSFFRGCIFGALFAHPGCKSEHRPFGS